MILKKWTLVCLIFFSSQAVFAAVNMRNASYTESWIDYIDPEEGSEIKIERFYSSRSLFLGLFGFGWCSSLETKLDITSDGIINLTECGGGLEITYYPENFDLKTSTQTIDQIVDHISKQKKMTINDIKNLKVQLENNTKMRFTYANQLHLVDIQKIKSNKNTFHAKTKGIEKMTFDGQFYERRRQDGVTEKFDSKGLLVQVTNSQGLWLRLNYKGPRLAYLVDYKGRRLNFAYDTNGKLVKIFNGTGLESIYQFEGENLKMVTNMWSKKYVYSYDGAHNLTDVQFPDNTTIKMSYDVSNDWIKSYTNRNKCRETFEFQLSKNDPKNNYWGTFKRTCPKEKTTIGRHEFWYKAYTFSTDKYLNRVMETFEKDIRDIYFHPFLGRPVTVRENLSYTGYAYYINGLVNKREYKQYTLAQVIEDWQKSTYQYDLARLLMTEENRTTLNPAGKPIEQKKLKFEYDSKGLLKKAQSSDGSFVSVQYNRRGQISSLKNNKKLEISLSYNDEIEKPIQISQKDLGDIRITYDNQGDVEKIENKSTRNISTSIVSNLMSLLDQLGPMGEQLAF